MVERQKRLALETEVDGYKGELQEAYKVIVELRYSGVYILLCIDLTSSSLYPSSSHTKETLAKVKNKQFMPSDWMLQGGQQI